MDNVYDLIADFYDNDEGWNTVLYRGHVEGFFRREAWDGYSDEELQEQWQYILMFCLYLGNSDTLLGDMSDDDIIDAIAWCGRNISELNISYASVEAFLNLLSRLFVYLKEKKAITSAVAPQLAKEKMLKSDHTLAIIDEKGEFLLGEERRSEFATADIPSKIFLNMGEALNELLEELHLFFQNDSFNLDLERAVFLYQGFFSEDEFKIEAESEGFWQCFWDYFLFDYHLISNDKTPLKHFADSKKSYKSELVQELLKSRLAIFTVEECRDDDLYFCKDFLTGEDYILNLPLDEETNLDNMLMVGHIFYNKSMVMNYVRCLTTINKMAQKRLYDLLMKAYQWYNIQEPNGTIDDFIARHPMVLRRLVYTYAHYYKIDSFNMETNVQDYIPEENKGSEDAVVRCIEQIMKPQHFSQRDISLATRLWKDFSLKETNAIRKPEVWASGVLENYVTLNGVYSYSDESIAEMCWNVPITTLQLTANKIKQALRIEKHDPRYLNEEGFLMMLFSQNK